MIHSSVDLPGRIQDTSSSASGPRQPVDEVVFDQMANQTLAAASAIFAWTIREDILKVNPCQQIERNTTVSRERILSDSEIPLFWTAFDDVFEGTLLKMILLTGQRPGEVRCMGPYQ